MTFRTLLFAVIAFGFVSGWVSPLILPMMLTMQKDQVSVVDGKPCRGVKTIFDSSDTPSCFEKVAKGLARGDWQAEELPPGFEEILPQLKREPSHSENEAPPIE